MRWTCVALLRVTRDHGHLCVVQRMQLAVLLDIAPIVAAASVSATRSFLVARSLHAGRILDPCWRSGVSVSSGRQGKVGRCRLKPWAGEARRAPLCTCLGMGLGNTGVGLVSEMMFSHGHS